MRASKVLKAAAEIIERRGWIQDHGGGECGPRCLRTAILEAADEVPSRDRECVRLVRHHLDLHEYVELHDWNDAPGRTKEDVLEALRATAAKCR